MQTLADEQGYTCQMGPKRSVQAHLHCQSLASAAVGKLLLQGLDNSAVARFSRGPSGWTRLSSGTFGALV